MRIDELADFPECLIIVECRHLIDLLAVTRRLVGLHVDDGSCIGYGENTGVVIVAMTGVVNSCECDCRSQQRHEQDRQLQHAPSYFCEMVKILTRCSSSGLNAANASPDKAGDGNPCLL